MDVPVLRIHRGLPAALFSTSRARGTKMALVIMQCGPHVARISNRRKCARTPTTQSFDYTHKILCAPTRIAVDIASNNRKPLPYLRHSGYDKDYLSAKKTLSLVQLSLLTEASPR